MPCGSRDGMLTNYHTHTTWCDGRNTPGEMVVAALEAGFSELGFSSHAMLPGGLLDWTLVPSKAVAYAAEIRSLAAKYASRIRILCGVEADWIPGSAEPSRAAYASISPDYIIGSVHFVVPPGGGGLVCVDKSPEELEKGIQAFFGGDARAYVSAYFAAVREMCLKFDFDIVGHADLARKFNMKHPLFDETAPWYLGELEATADAIAKSGKIAEINTGAISRGWLADAYPSDVFRAMLAARGVKFIYSSDAHSVSSLDCAWDRYSKYCIPSLDEARRP